MQGATVRVLGVQVLPLSSLVRGSTAPHTHTHTLAAPVIGLLACALLTDAWLYIPRSFARALRPVCVRAVYIDTHTAGTLVVLGTPVCSHPLHVCAGGYASMAADVLASITHA